MLPNAYCLFTCNSLASCQKWADNGCQGWGIDIPAIRATDAPSINATFHNRLKCKKKCIFWEVILLRYMPQSRQYVFRSPVMTDDLSVLHWAISSLWWNESFFLLFFFRVFFSLRLIFFHGPFSYRSDDYRADDYRADDYCADNYRSDDYHSKSCIIDSWASLLKV